MKRSNSAFFEHKKQDETATTNETTITVVAFGDLHNLNELHSSIKHNGSWVEANPRSTVISVPTKQAVDIKALLSQHKNIISLDGEVTEAGEKFKQKQTKRVTEILAMAKSISY